MLIRYQRLIDPHPRLATDAITKKRLGDRRSAMAIFAAAALYAVVVSSWVGLALAATGKELAQNSLPSENSWPGDIRPLSTLPDESSWPEQPKPPSVAMQSDEPSAIESAERLDVAANPPVPRPLPAESTWPIAMTQAGPHGNGSPDSAVPNASTEIESDIDVDVDPDAESLVSPTTDRPNDSTPASDENKADDILSEATGKAIDERPWLRLQSRGPIAPVRSMTFTQDGSRLVAAGEDKHTLIWHRDDNMAADARWQYERTVRWQVQRGPLGHVFAVSAAPDLLAMGGHGAMGGHAEIWLVDPRTGDWRATLVEPDNSQEQRQVITGLQFAHQDGIPHLIASDRQGEITVWSRGENQWNRVVIVPSDIEQYGVATAERLEPFRGFSPVAVVGKFAIAPQWKSFASDGTPEWILARIPLDGSAPPSPLHPTGPLHRGFVTTLAVAEQPEQLASCDGNGQLTVWQLGSSPKFKTMDLDGPALTLSLSQDGHRLLVGTAIVRGAKKPSWQIWDTTNLLAPKQISSHITSGPVRAGALSPDGQFAAVALNRLVEVHDLRRPQSIPQRLHGAIEVPTDVAFPVKSGDYRLRLTCPSMEDSTAATIHIFDTQQVQLSTVVDAPQDSSADKNKNDWTDTQRFRGDWNLQRDERELGVYWLERTGKGKPIRQCRIQFAPQYFGVPTAWTWIPTAGIPTANSQPFALAIATSGHNNIYVYRLTDRGDAPLLRQFRGHGARVNSLSIAADRRYLASTSDDGTARIWNLEGFDAENPQLLRWGARFAVDDQQLTVSEIRPDSPLYFRGLRSGDTVRRLKWVEPVATHDQSSGNNVLQRETVLPQEMTRLLEENDWKTPVTFTLTRGRDLEKSFQSLPAWQPLVSLVISTDREWAYWTPAGYYDASFEGHRLFGWQFNRGLYLMPDFFLAAQLRASLERPNVMSRLLHAGNLEDAFRLSHQESPASPQQAIVSAHRLRPHIQLLTPQPRQSVTGDTLEITADVFVRTGQTLIPPKAFANGVVATDRVLRGVESVTRDNEYWQKHTYHWKAQLPHDPQLLIQVIASTDQELADEATVELARSALPKRGRSRLYLVTAGINEYRDRQVQSLDFAVNNVVQLKNTLEKRTSQFYKSQTLALLNQRVTRPMWEMAMDQTANELRATAQPDDLLVIFLSGHGIRDPEDDNYYYLTANSRLSDVLARQYDDCLSFADFSRLADIPCRKLVVLDTCHSGAIQPPRQRELKAAVRALQNDMIMTLTASQGRQEAAELREKNMGRFTFHLLAGLNGSADSDRDGMVTLPEVARYVQAMVQQESAGDEVPQVPTSGPSELLRIAQIPLTTAESPRSANSVPATPQPKLAAK